MVFGEKSADLLENIESQNWYLGNFKLAEKDVWKNLGKIWHVRANDMKPIENAVKEGYVAGMEIASVGCISGGISKQTSKQIMEKSSSTENVIWQ